MKRIGRALGGFEFNDGGDVFEVKFADTVAEVVGDFFAGTEDTNGGDVAKLVENRHQTFDRRQTVGEVAD